MSDEEPRGLPVKGYKPTQERASIDAVNRLKVLEEHILRELDGLEGDVRIDKRSLALARTHIQTGTMWAARAVFQPQRLTDAEMGDEVESLR